MYLFKVIIFEFRYRNEKFKYISKKEECKQKYDKVIQNKLNLDLIEMQSRFQVSIHNILIINC